ncbi:hypothetical protein N5P37_009474 [Trichoderma harzianum]|uniref:Major facilitator superfamily (MFS) profile domain-containing protein n=1 Tax=Trichoderma harzianum CBS 226.95 TaxID=983964 RepID=A0A2T4A7Z4_TRIHA|nr:hypothetical protein M431DRAFT_496435 [Trichoderma harzianum CBS 226.95]KAK0758173.1 hypothetical protein N5P37_009474 [Trichoderma harzianum]PKK51572.1 hypothetical protein CI102_3477 [Trichoderma harzianum]PTB53113.1 hypothetical protein M431DRAFT_496435 [Trichoderma harzianum CBS 226.95]
MATAPSSEDIEKMDSPIHASVQDENLPVVEPKLSRRGLPLIPQPSDDPFDPLNFASWRKILILLVMCIWTIIGPLNMISVASAFFPISEELHMSLSSVTYLVGAPLLSYGVASLIWVSVGNRFGVRLVFVFTSLATGLFCIWGAVAKSSGSLIAARTLASIFSASPETLGPQAIADVFFLHDRAKCMGLYVLFQASGFAVGSLIGGYITADLGWRWIQWTVSFLSLGSCGLLFLFFPETQYTRQSGNLHHRQPKLVDNFRFWAVSGGGRSKVDSLWKSFCYPFKYLPHPAVIAMTIHFSIMLMATNYMLTSNTFIYTGVYNFDIKQIALTGFAPLIAVWIAIPYCGILNDVVISRLRKRANFLPEWRLMFFVPTCIIGPVGCIVVGVCAQNGSPWIAPLIGEALVMFCFVTANNLTQTYLVDIYEARADATLVVLNGFKNFAAFGISYAVVPWNTSAGYAEPFGVLAALVFVAHIPIFIFWWRGKEIREWSAKHWKEAKPSHHGDAF